MDVLQEILIPDEKSESSKDTERNEESWDKTYSIIYKY